jgi:hypothetical protein
MLNKLKFLFLQKIICNLHLNILFILYNLFKLFNLDINLCIIYKSNTIIINNFLSVLKYPLFPLNLNKFNIKLNFFIFTFPLLIFLLLQKTIYFNYTFNKDLLNNLLILIILNKYSLILPLFKNNLNF